MKRTTLYSLLILFVFIPLTLFLGTKLSGKGYYLTSTLIIIETMLPFFLAFEGRKPQVRELVSIAVMAALAVAGRVAIPIPNFKAVTAIVMITGIAFGPQAGFMTGAIAAFASNFFYSQGPWTPWQMLSYGMCGLICGILFCNRKVQKTRYFIPAVSIFSFFCILFLAGPLLDSATLFTTGSRISWKFALAVYTAGLLHNITHGLSCAATILLIGKPLLAKLERLKTKYGLLNLRDAT